MQDERRSETATLVEIMDLNHGVLRAAEHPYSRSAFEGLIRQGAIVRVLPGTFVDATLLDCRHTRYAAALAHHRGSALWAEAAAAVILGDLTATPFRPAEPIQLALPRRIKPQPGIRASYRQLPEPFVSRRFGLRMPSPAYLAVHAAARDEGRLAERVLREGLASPAHLVEALACFEGTRGQAIRRQVVRTSADNPWSGGERELQATLRKARLTGWIANAPLRIGSRLFFPDILFEAERLILEFDGYAVHQGEHAFERDRERMNRLQLAGYLVLRFTWARLQNPDSLVGEIRAALRLRRNLAS